MRERMPGSAAPHDAPGGEVSHDGGGRGLPEPYRQHLVGFVESLDATMHEIQRLAADGARPGPCFGPGVDVPSPVTRGMLMRVTELRALATDLREALGLMPHSRSGLHYLRAVVAIAVDEAEASLPANNMLAAGIAPTHRCALEGTLHQIRDLLAGMHALLRSDDARA